MNWPLIWVVGLLAAAVFMFVRNKPRMDAVGLLMVAALPFTGVLTMSETLAGFADPNIVLIAVLFVLGEGLVRTGVARSLGDMISKKAGGNELTLLFLLMVTVAVMGSVMSSTAIVAIFIPVVLRICRTTGIHPSRLLMPLSIAALISGMMTLIATAPNLVVNSELERQALDGFNFFSVTPFGVMILVLALGYVAVARRYIPERESEEKSNEPSGFGDLITKYALEERERRVRVLPTSSVVGKALDSLDLRAAGVNILAVERTVARKRRLLRAHRDFVLLAGDVLLLDVRGPMAEARTIAENFGVEVLPRDPKSFFFTDLTQEIGMTEVIIPPDSSLVGQTVRASRLRPDHGLTVIGIRHGSEAVRSEIVDEVLHIGDTMLITGFWKDIKRLQGNSKELVMLDLPQEYADVLPAAGKAPIALTILALVVITMVLGVIPHVQAVLIGCLLMGLFGIIDMESAYRSISWKTLILIVGMLPFSLALQRTGGVDIAASVMLDLVGDQSLRLALAVLFLVTMILGMFISNTATAVLMAPVAITMAANLDSSPLPFAMIVMLAASTAFVTPVSSPVNMLVVAPGNYQFGDFVKIGLPLSIIVLIASVITVPFVFPP